MSIARLVRYLIGVVIAFVVLAIVLPLIGIPSSHFLPPSWVYPKADGATRGVITGKYYVETNNPFRIGTHYYFVDYEFKAKAPATIGEAQAGKARVYPGEVRVDQGAYDRVMVDPRVQPGQYKAHQIVPVAPGQYVKVRYDKTYPYINGVFWPEPLTGRSVGEGSNMASGWMIWIVVALVLGYGIMMILEQFGNKENI